MEFTCERGDIFDTLNAVQSVIPGRSTHPVLSNVLFGAEKGKVSILGTDLDVSMIGEFPAQIISEGFYALPAKKLLELLKEFGPGELKIRRDKSRVEISQGSGRFFIGGVEKEDYPAEDIMRGEQTEIRFSAEDFKRFLSGTSYAISVDIARIALSGLLFEITGSEVTSVATDGHRLTMLKKKMNIKEEEKKELNLPAKTVTHLNRMITDAEEDVVIKYGEGTARIIFGGFTLTTKLINERFPDYNQVIPKDNKSVMICDRANLTSAVKRASVLSNPLTHLVRFSIKEDKLAISCSDYDVSAEAHEEIAVEYSSEPINIGFNSSYLLEVLRHFNTDEVKLLIKNSLSAALFLPLPQKEDEEYLSILMPLRLPEEEV
ncbi:DNA polymerase III subunit beta [bacterium]|nr:DNA polymerase III subunit beta [bacterium]